VLTPDGEPAGRLLLPARSPLEAADSAHAWVVERDEVDIPSVVRYRLRPGN